MFGPHGLARLPLGVLGAPRHRAVAAVVSVGRPRSMMGLGSVDPGDPAQFDINAVQIVF